MLTYNLYIIGMITTMWLIIFFKFDTAITVKGKYAGFSKAIAILAVCAIFPVTLPMLVIELVQARKQK